MFGNWLAHSKNNPVILLLRRLVQHLFKIFVDIWRGCPMMFVAALITVQRKETKTGKRYNHKLLPRTRRGRAY